MGQSRHVIEVRGNDLRATMELGLALARLIEASGGTAELNQWRLVQVTPPGPSAWAYPVSYAIGAVVTYAGKTYRCRQAHTSQAGWTPPVVPALWLEI